MDGKIRGKGGACLRLRRQLPDQQEEQDRQRRQQDRQSGPGRSAGDGQAGAGFKAGALLHQTQHKGGRAAQHRCRGKYPLFFHVGGILSDENIDGNIFSSIARSISFVYAGSHVPALRRISWGDRPVLRKRKRRGP